MFVNKYNTHFLLDLQSFLSAILKFRSRAIRRPDGIGIEISKIATEGREQNSKILRGANLINAISRLIVLLQLISSVILNAPARKHIAWKLQLRRRNNLD